MLTDAQVIAIVGAASAAATIMLTGFWDWFKNRSKNKIEAEAAVVNGFVTLLKQYENRLIACEAENLRLENRIKELEGVRRWQGTGLDH